MLDCGKKQVEYNYSETNLLTQYTLAIIFIKPKKGR